MKNAAEVLEAPALKPRRGPAEHLRDALLALAGGHGEVVSHSEKAWASITFEGARHVVTLRFADAEAVEAGEAMIAVLPDHEFAIPGQLVADASVTEVEHSVLPHPVMMVTCELLLLVDG